MIEPRTLKGFRDFTPAMMIPREALIDTARRVYRSFGFSPIDTPVLEHLEVLMGKGGEESDRLMYSFKDHGDRPVGMRFDLTVPFARFAAQHIGVLGTPFKRYHIAKVWRGENTHRGRYREFMQCDFDTIGTDSVVSDIETILVINDLMLALGIEDFKIQINNRQVLTGVLDGLGIAEQSALVLRSLDKLAKIGREKVHAEMVKFANIDPGQADRVLELSNLSGSNDQILTDLQSVVGANEIGTAGAERLRQVVDGARAAGVSDERMQVDVSIARGLDYYTGTIVETILTKLPEIGSVCSGGRYDNLAGLYTKQKLPGIGASLGLDRLLAALDELKLIETVSTPSPVFIPYFDKNRLHAYLKLANTIRKHGIGVEVFPEPKKLGQQLKYADRRGFRVAVIAGEQELDSGTCQLKNLADGEKQDVSTDDEQVLIDRIRSLLT